MAMTTIGTPAIGRDLDRHPAAPHPSPLRFDPPAAHLAAIARGSADTLWFGGTAPDGTAIPGGVWDFEDGTLQGWTSTDLTDFPTYFRHVTADSCAAHEDAVCPVMNGIGSIWVGRHEDDARTDCWPGGQGYGNRWIQSASRSFDYAGTGTVTLAFDYFTDSETQFDFTYVYASVDGVASWPLNTSSWATPEGWGYSGAVEEGTAIGSPSAPAHDEIVIDADDLPVGPGPVEIEFRFESDPLYSDGLDSFGGFLNSHAGAFGLDDVHVSGDGLDVWSDFETGPDGWTFSAAPAIGAFAAPRDLGDLEPETLPCACPISGGVLTFFDEDGDSPHPETQFEQVRAPAAWVGAGSGAPAAALPLVAWSTFEHMPWTDHTRYAASLSYYPWTCPTTGITDWSPVNATLYEPGTDDPRCRIQSRAFSSVPPDLDSLAVVFTLLAHCSSSHPPCGPFEDRNPSPYLDDIRLGLVGAETAAPVLDIDLTYQDAFPRSNSLLPTATADVSAFLDLRADDGDPTNALLGDSVVVHTGTSTAHEVYLNFRVYPGPGTDVGDPFFTDARHGGNALAPTWARGRMDTVLVSAGDRYFGSYYWPDGEDAPATSKIIPDGVLTPGTTVEYFFSTNYTALPDVERTAPDTTGGFHLEFEVLPGYLEIAGDVMTPCHLYVDAFDAGVQRAIEDHGLRPALGTFTDDAGLEHAGWDRYDHAFAETPLVAPLAREVTGDNGMTKLQSLVYRHILYNTGSLTHEGLRDGDADLLAHWLSTDTYDRWAVEKSLWLSGDGMGRILSRDGRLDANNLLANFAGAFPVDDTDTYTALTGDTTLCVRLDPAPGRHFPPADESIASLRGGGCPDHLAFEVLTPLADAEGDLVYADQDAGGGATGFASISNERVPPSDPANYRVVLDGFSLERLRGTPDGWTGEDCAFDSSAITERVSQVFGWTGVPFGLCDPPEVVSVPGEGGGPGTVPRVTRVYASAPNPFTPRTTIRFDLATDAHVRLEILDAAGRRVRTLTSGPRPAAAHRIEWDGRSDGGARVASGVYWARLHTSTGYEGSTRLVVLR